MADESNAKTIASLQILRFLAALIVVLDHLGFVGQATAHGLGLSFYFPEFSGRFGVDIFFVISGFIMVYITTDRDDANRERWAASPGGFFADRVARIVPIYFVATFCYVILYFISGNFTRWSPLHFMASLLFFPYFDLETHLPQPVLSQGWTLDYEMFFYLIFSVALFFRRSIGLLLLCLTFLALVFVGQMLTYETGQSFALTPMAERADLLPLRFWTHPIILEFLVGILLALARDFLLRSDRLVGFQHPILVCIIIMTGCIFILNKSNHDSTWVATLRSISAVLVVAVCVLTRQSRDLSKIQQLLVFLGGCSYSLYLFHPHVIFFMSSLWKRFGWLLGMNLFVPLGTLASIVVSVLVFKLVEEKIAGAWKAIRKSRFPASAARSTDGGATIR